MGAISLHFSMIAAKAKKEDKDFYEEEMKAVEGTVPILSNNIYSCYTYEDRIIICFHMTDS